MKFPHLDDLPGANAEVTISRDSSNAFKIKVVDRISRTRVVEVSMDAVSFAFALTGMASVKALAEYGSNLDNIGKERVSERRVVDCPLDVFDKKMLCQWLLDNCQEEGWQIDTYLGSQNSINPRLDGEKGRRLSYGVFKYVDQQKSEE